MGRLLNAVRSGRYGVAETMYRRDITAAVGCSTGSLRLGYFRAVDDSTVTTMAAQGHTTAAGATPTLVRFGLYSIAANGDGTLIASTPNDTALFAVGSTFTEKALSVPVSLTRGSLYAAALLVVSGAATPTVAGMASIGTVLVEDERVSGLINSQTDLPGSFVVGDVGSFTGIQWIGLA